MNISRRTIISTVINLLALVNAIMVMIGRPVLTVSDDQISVVVNVAITVVVWAYGFWKNNSFTTAAIKADEFLDLLRHDEWIGERVDDTLYYEDDEEPEDEEDGNEKTN